MNRQMGSKGKSKSLRRRRLSGSRRRGQALIEMAASIFLLLAILMGVMEFGWLITRTYAVGNATREGARYAALGHTTSEVQTKVINTGGSNFISASNITMQYYDTSTSTWKTMTDLGTSNTVTPGNQIRVTVTVAHKSLTNFFPFLRNRNITQFTVMRREL